MELVHDRWTIPSGGAPCHAVEPRLRNDAPEPVEPRVDARGLIDLSRDLLGETLSPASSPDLCSRSRGRLSWLAAETTFSWRARFHLRKASPPQHPP